MKTPHPVHDDPAARRAIAWQLRMAERPLTTEERQRLAQWLDADPANRAAFGRAGDAWATVGEAGLSPGLLAMRGAALAGFRRAQRRRWAWRVPVPGAIAAALAATLLLALLAGGLGRWPETYDTRAGERRQVVLRDGSELSLDADTRVRVSWSRDRRALRLLRGRAKFEVAKDPERAFTVTAATKTVVATGTAFSVELLQRDVRVILYEGRVAVFDAPARGAPPEPVRLDPETPAPDRTLLLPGRELIAAIDAPAARIADADPQRSLAWEAGQLVFVDEPLASAVERVNRHTDDALAVGDAAAAAVRIDGVFTARDTDAFVEAVTEVFPVTVRQRDGRRTFFALRDADPPPSR
ncbi:FecR family protein [Luteimonas suaedae]|uniref:FecR family protein n=1 Tax=Luteimonas suaedae TaxID=2605430 RepID=UPI0011EC0E7E|nr:FecR domain-containing protein [Luteimonas suaedae]